MKKTTLSWRQVQALGEKLSRQISASEFKPDYLVGIAVGGLIPLALLAEALEIKNIATISVNSYNGTKRGRLHVGYLPKIDLKNKKILLVDEIAETGETLKQVLKILIGRYRVGEIKTATLAINKAKCKFLPNFFAFENNKWIVFPWEKDSQ